MKRLRSFGDDIGSIGEKGFSKDWGRRELRDHDVDRSSNRRYNVKQEGASRKGSSSSSGYDRSLENEDREASRGSRKRFDYNDLDSFDRRKGFDKGFDRYRDRDLVSPSSRSGYGDNRERDSRGVHRSESFGGPRRDFPKGFRSERDRSRREESVSSWRRFSRGKDVDEEPRVSVDSGKGSSRGEERGNLRSPSVVKSPTLSKDSKDSGVEQPKNVESVGKKNEEVVVESGNTSEMEEGELEPEPNPRPEQVLEQEPECKPEHDAKASVDSKTDKGVESESDRKTECGSSIGDQADSKERTVVDKEVVCDKPQKVRIVEVVTDDTKESEKLKSCTDNNIGEPVVMEGSVGKNPALFPLQINQPLGPSNNKEAEDNEVMSNADEREKQDKEGGIEVEKGKEVVEDGKSESSLIPTKDKGKSLAVSISSLANFIDDSGMVERDFISRREDAMEGPSSRGFEFFISPATTKSEKTNHSYSNKNEDENTKMEPLELSLGLPNVNLSLAASQESVPAPNSPQRMTRSVQPLATSFRTGSEGFTTSISFSGSQSFMHNPSCSLTHNSFDNYENSVGKSVGSRPLFQGVDWQALAANEPKRKETPFYQKVLQNGNGPHSSQGQQNIKVSEGNSGKPFVISQSASLQRQMSAKSQTRSKDEKKLFRSHSQRDMEQFHVSGTGNGEMIIMLIISQPIQVMTRRFQEMPEQSIAGLKEGVCEIITKEKREKLLSFQEALQNRSDLNLDTLLKAHRNQLEILVALKTGSKDFLLRSEKISPTDLAEIFLNMKCRNLDCRSVLPVDECECKVCSQKNGFCSACMCLVCSKFDMASNTCSWVGCDVCLHWCHTDCGLRQSYIRNGLSVSGPKGTSEMQFQCVACNHPSEMFGFVKEVFKTCAKDWKVETLVKELQYVKRIFSASNDIKGKLLHEVSDKLLMGLENGCKLLDAYNHINGFLTEIDSKLILHHKNLGEGSNGAIMPNREPSLLKSVSTEKTPRLENTTPILPTTEKNSVAKCTNAWDPDVAKKPIMDELDSIVKIKLEEAKMFQTRADDARREAEGLKRIAVAKNEKVEEEYTARVSKLRLAEVEERRRQKLEELQVLERSHREYFNMKLRMEADITNLLSKMEATKQNLST